MNRPKIVHWTQDEKRIFFECLNLYNNDFYSYTMYLNRSHSQIKSFYHNWLKTLLPSVRSQFPFQHKGGSHVRYRNQKRLETNVSNPKDKSYENSLLISNWKSVE
ncbi:Homeobox-like_domain superfamily [Hexamita inflata]|uniref:Homeobox-like_domain superfamily n=1 Tax=Hexamita inflata TaxID=28002 RepID=A0ABP1JV46_9EUKA